MNLVIGSNKITDTNGVLKVSGKDQIWLEIDEETTQVLITMDIYNPKGKKVAKIRRNAWAFNENKLYDITTSPSSLKLINKKTGKPVVEVKVIDKDNIEIQQGEFYTQKGNLLKITPEYWKIDNGLQMKGNIISGFGTAVTIE